MNEPALLAQATDSLELQAFAIGKAIIGTERQSLVSAEQLLELYLRWQVRDQLASGRGEEAMEDEDPGEFGQEAGFYRWFERVAGVPKSTAHRYIRIGRAAKQGWAVVADEDGEIQRGKDGEPETRTLGVLASIGRGIEKGLARSEISAALQGGSVSRAVEAKESGGTVQVRMPLSAAESRDRARTYVTKVLVDMPPGSVDEVVYALVLATSEGDLRRVFERLANGRGG